MNTQHPSNSTQATLPLPMGDERKQMLRQKAEDDFFEHIEQIQTDPPVLPTLSVSSPPPPSPPPSPRNPYDKSTLPFYTQKAMVCNSAFEFFHYTSVIFLNQKVNIKTDYTLIELVAMLLFTCSKEGLQKRRQNALASARRLRSLIYGNFDINDKFITLTFADDNDFNITNLKICNKRKERYIAKLLEIKPDLKYVVVPEYQKRGAVHYHMICNLPYMPKDDFHSLWSYGFSSIRAMGNLQKAYKYLSKYITKGFMNPDFYRLRRYYVSNSCVRPTAFYEEAACEIEHSIASMGIAPMVEFAVSPFDTLETTFLDRYAAYKIAKPLPVSSALPP